MKTGKYNFKLMCLITVFVVNIAVIAVETPPIRWNETAQSRILNKKELVKLGAAFPFWKIKQITWPPVTEINSKSVAVDEKLKASCTRWLQKFTKKGYLPEDFSKHLIAMKNWGLIRKESEQKRLCDVFVARFEKYPYVIHIQESPYNVVIGVADERLANDARADHRNLVIETAKSILNETLKPDPNSEEVHVFKIERDELKVSRVSWGVESVKIRAKDGKRCIDLRKAWKLGATHVEVETDGRFVKFEIVKQVKGPRAFPDPYVERFSTSK